MRWKGGPTARPGDQLRVITIRSVAAVEPLPRSNDELASKRVSVSPFRGDTVRVKNRLKSVLRSRGLACGAGRSVYSKRDREEWLARLPEASRATAGLLYEEHDALMALRAKAEKALLAEARKHREWHVLKTCPGLGPIRTAELLPVVVTPYRFQSRSRFWAYCGLGVVMRSSSDWVRGPGGRWVREAVQQTRGLNRNFNHTLKRVFKGAATTVIGRAGDEPLYRHYERLLEGGTKPNLAKLTIARQLASIVLAAELGSKGV